MSSVNPLIPTDVIEFVVAFYGDTRSQILPLAGDASARRYFRVTRGEEHTVLMKWEPFVDDGSYPFLSVHMHLAHHGVLVPKVLAKDPAAGIILLEDLGDLTLERKFWENQNQALALPYYKLAIDEIIKIHFPATFDKAANCVGFGIAFDTDKLLWEMNYGREHLIEKLAQIQLTPGLSKELDRDFTSVCKRLDKEEKHLCHRDYHSRNIMILRGHTRIIDFQDARMGPIQYDLVSLVHDSYVQLNESSQAEILDHYLIRAKDAQKKSIDRDRFFDIMRLQILQRCFKACGSFSSFYNTREDTRYLKYISSTLKKIRSTLNDFPEFTGFISVFDDFGLTEIDFRDPTTNIRDV